MRLNKLVKTKELFEVKTEYLKKLFEDSLYPWEILPNIKAYINSLIEAGLEGFTELSEGVYVGKDVKIYPTAVIEGPAIIGSGTEIRPGAFIRGSVITGENCVIGNSSEIKNSVLLDKVQVPHYNYVGDSVLGFHAHMGAGSITSNIKSDRTNVVIHDENEILVTGLRKMGAMLGDYVEVGCNSVLNPGTMIGAHTNVYPLSMVRGCVPAWHIYKDRDHGVEKLTDSGITD